MTPQEIEIARRAVACKAWRWMPGMLVNSSGTIYRMTEETIALGCGSPEHQREYMRPNLTDPATLGCLLALVREAWRCDRYRVLTVEPSGAGWAPILRNARHRPPSRARGSWDIDRAHQRGAPLWIQEVSTEAEALVAALEAAP